LSFLYNFQPSPFFIVDKVDDALDNLNVTKVATYIYTNSCLDVKDSDGGKEIGKHILWQGWCLIEVYEDWKDTCCHVLHSFFPSLKFTITIAALLWITWI